MARRPAPSELLSQTAHRPWPLPRGPWVMRMTWRHLLFAHWPIEPERLRTLIPDGLEVETFDGRAWVGVIPLVMTGVRPRGGPPIPTAHRFPELNVRTYVTDGERPGVWFFSLDAASRLAVATARLTFGLNYRLAHMRCRADATDRVQYHSERANGEAAFDAAYRPIGKRFEASPGSLERFLTSRYRLYALRRGRLVRGEVHHAEWPLQRAEAEIVANTMTDPLGVELPSTAPHLLYAHQLDVLAWPPRRCA